MIHKHSFNSNRKWLLSPKVCEICAVDHNNPYIVSECETMSGWWCWINFCKFVKFPAEPWSVEDLLQEDDIIDKVPLQRLQSLSNNSVLCLFFFCLPQPEFRKALFLLLRGVLRFLFHRVSFSLQVNQQSWEIFSATPTWGSCCAPLTTHKAKTLRLKPPCRNLCLWSLQTSV